MSLEERCRGGFTDGDIHRGRSYFLQERVSVEAVAPTRVIARVRGSSYEPYVVRVDWAEAAAGRVTISCDCPRFADRIPCKHVWATLLACDQQGFSRQVPGTAPLIVELERSNEEWEESAKGSREDSRRARSLERPETPSAVPSPTDSRWREQMHLLRDALMRSKSSDPAPQELRREVWFWLDVQSALASGQLVVSFYHREIKQNGEWGKIKRLSLNREKVRDVEDARDRELLELLLATPSPDRFVSYSRYGGYYSNEQLQNSSHVPAALYDTVLPRLCATGRFTAEGARDQETAQPLAWDGGPAWKPVLRLDRDPETGTVAITGSLERADERRSLAEALLLLANGLVVFSDAIARLEAGDSFPWIGLLRRDGEIRVPEGQLNALLTEVFELPILPALQAPDDLTWQEERVTPRPCLAAQVQGQYQGYYYGPRKITAEIAFDYDGRTVAHPQRSASVYDAENRRVLLRDLDAERAALASLGELGFERPIHSHYAAYDYEIKPKAWPVAVERLIDGGWRLEFEQVPLRRSRELNLQVTTGIDWFEIEADVDFEDASIGLPQLLEALRRGDQFVTLDDGSQGLLPAEWFDRYRPLAHLASEHEGETVRFLPTQAVLLDALLAAMPSVDVDRKFERIRERLRSFERIEPAAEPRGFQGELRPYQREGVGWLRFLREFDFGGCLADDMGLGKTIQVLALLQGRRLSRGADRRPSLVVAPRSVLYNWAEESARFAPRLDVLIYHGPKRRDLLETFGQQNLIVTTYATLRLDISELKDVAFDYAVLDEAQAIKNAASQTAKACRLLQARHRLALTGTPVENHLGELWSIFEFLNPGMLGHLPRLKQWQGAKSLQGEALSTVANALRPFILRRTKEQVLHDLPEKTEQTLFCDLVGKQRKLYNELRAHYRAQLTQRVQKVGLRRSKIQVLEALLRLRQAACHPGLIDEERTEETSAKLDVLLVKLEEVLAEGHKALVFSQFVSLLKIVRGFLGRRGIVYEYLDGRTRKRQERVERFQTDDDCQLFLISLKAGGLGLNLTAADYVFILDPWWNPAVEAQAVDRAHRIGQTRPVFAYRLIARDTVEEKILQLQDSKRELADAILTADRSLIRNLTAEDLHLLLS